MNEPQAPAPQVPARRVGSEVLGGCVVLFLLPFLLAFWLWGVDLMGQAFMTSRQVLGL